MEARKEHQRQMAGSLVGMLLKPSRGLRDDILLSGGKPKDHSKDNRAHLKVLAKRNQQKKEDSLKPAPEPFRLKKFDAVSSKISTRRNSPASTPSPRPDTVASNAPSYSSIGTNTSKNFIALNAQRVIKSTTKTASPPIPVGVPRKIKLGAVPKYLVDRQLGWAEDRANAIRQAQEDKIPKGMMVLPEDVRLSTLESLKKNREIALQEINRFPVVIETPRMIMRKADLDAKIAQLEASIESFSRCTVLVDKMDYEQNFGPLDMKPEDSQVDDA